MKILVIGGTGILSGGVVQGLLRAGHRVTIFHRGKSPAPDGADEILGDRSDAEAFVVKVRNGGPWDVVVDMIGGSASDAAGLVTAVGGRVEQVILCSTTTVYERPFPSIPLVETDAVLVPPSPYGVNKLECENTLRAAEAQGLFHVTILRPGHLISEGGNVLHSLGNRTSHLDRILNGRPIIVHDDGNGLWSSLWCGDTAFAFVAAVGTAAAFGETFHLSGPHTFTWDEYHATIANALGCPPPQIVHIPAERLAQIAPARAAQCLRTLRYPGVYDCSRAFRILGFNPGTGLEACMRRNIDCLRAAERIESWIDDPEYEQLASQAVSG